jgi:hypothetical protein
MSILLGVQWNFEYTSNIFVGNSIISLSCQRLVIFHPDYVHTCYSQTADKQMPSRESTYKAFTKLQAEEIL